MTDALRVLLVDDQELFRAGLSVVLAAQPGIDVVGQAADGQAALQAVRETRPDVMLLDLRMPVLDGIGTVAALFDPSWVGSRPRVVVLTTFAADAAAAEAIRLGASGFLMKDASPEFLIASLKAVHGGSAVIAPNDLTPLLGAPQARPPIPADFRTLTDRERRVFDLVVQGSSNAEIGRELFLAGSTVKTHVSSILTKLDARDRLQLVVYAHRHGLGAPTPDGDG